MQLDERETTLDEPLLVAHDHTLLLRAVQQHTPAIVEALGRLAERRPLPAAAVLRAIAQLPDADSKTQLTARQVLTFLDPLAQTPLPQSYTAALGNVEKALAAAPNPMGVVAALTRIKEANLHDKIGGFQRGVDAALDLMGDALGTAGTMMTGVTVFGRADPAAVARACARGCVHGAMVGTLSRVPPEVSGVVGGVAGSTTALVAVTMDARRRA